MGLANDAKILGCTSMPHWTISEGIFRRLGGLMRNIPSTIPGWHLSLLTVAALSWLVAGGGKAQTSLESKPSGKSSGPGKVVLYAAVGAELTQYDVDVDGAGLVKRGSITLPANVQEATP